MARSKHLGIALGTLLLCSVISTASGWAASVNLVIDTDPGVDDATALVWLLYQNTYSVNILGIGTVFGNTSPSDGANNVLTILNAVGRRGIPVAIGAPQPLSQPFEPGPWLGLRSPALLHGSDGLWGIGQSHPHSPTEFDARDAATLYRDLAIAHPGATLLALGPLTNLALAFSNYPDAMRLYGRIVIGAGAKYGGNRTPSAEYSLWQDPEAASQVFSARLGPPILVLPLDAFQKFSMNLDDVHDVCEHGRDALRLICPALEAYVSSQLSPIIGRTRAWVPDVATAMYALDVSLGTAVSGLIRVATGDGMMRGHTEIALTLLERITLIGSDAELNRLTELSIVDPMTFAATLAELLYREQDNAAVVVDINAKEMYKIFRRAVTSNH